ncbi:MAG: porin family protein [Gammaproteobacteria bacterium]|nr:porin family protein [Gammaproteobacteria bacterium]MDH5311215.1 porin family protein [Gammaproteobacteria bacterium]
MNRIVELGLVFALLCLPIPALSQDRVEPGWYVGGGASLNDVYSYDDYCWGCYGSSEYGDGDIGFTLTGGYRINDFLAVEGSYFGESSMHWDQDAVLVDAPPGIYNVDADVTLSSFQVNVLGILAGQFWEGYLRAGLALWDAQSDQRLLRFGTGEVLTRVVDASGEDLVIGIGVGRRFGSNWQVRLDYAYYPVEDDLLALEGNAERAYTDFMTVQLIHRFGPRRD